MSSLLQTSILKLNLTLCRQCKQFAIGIKSAASKNHFKKPSTKNYARPNHFNRSPATNIPDNALDDSEFHATKFPGTVKKPFFNRTKHRSFALYETSPLTLAAKLDRRPKQKFDYFLVLDFEATCDSPSNLDPQEIIEFPVLKINSNTFETESTFHSYIRPEMNPILTSFCTELTGVIQSMVDNEPLFKEVFEKFLDWLSMENLLHPEVKFAFATCGDPDLDYLLPLQCYLSGIEVPDYMKQWINVKRSFCEISPYTWPDNLKYMMRMCELEHSGDLHSGIDDAKNVVRVMADLADRGLVFDINGWIKEK